MGAKEQKSAKTIISEDEEKWNDLRTMKRNAEIRAQKIIEIANQKPEKLKEGMIAFELDDDEWGLVHNESPYWKGLKYLPYEHQVVVNRLFEAGLNPQTKFAPHKTGCYVIKIHR